MTPSRKSQFLPLLALLSLTLLFAGCDADSPTAPVSQAQNPDTTSGNSTWSITVTVTPNIFTIGDSQTTGFITVRASRVSNGGLPPEGSSAVVSSSGGFLSTNEGQSGSSVPVIFDETGTARANISVAGFNSPGSIVVRAQLEGSFGSATLQIVETPDDTTGEFGLTEMTPTFGPPTGGTQILVTGSDFEFPMKAAFCETTLVSTVLGDCVAMTNLTILDKTQFTAITPRFDLPSGQDQTVNLVVEKDGGSGGTDGLPNAFTYTRNVNGPGELLVLSVSPTSGPNEGGTQVTIRGAGFSQEAQVYFSNGPLIEATVLSITSSTIRAITPSATGPNSANANSIVNIVVRDPVTGQQATLNRAFQYGAGGGTGMFISAVGPNEVPYTGGTLVTIFGQGFDEPVAVEAGGFGQTPVSVTATEVVFRTVPADIQGCSETSGAVSVTNIDTGESASGPDLTYLAVEPVILSISPPSGPEGGGNTIIITGVANGISRGFDPPVRVTIGGRLATVTSVSANGSSLSVVAPQFTGTFNQIDCSTSAGTGIRFLDTPVDITVENIPTGCEDSVSEAYVYEPLNVACQITTPTIGPTASFTTAVAGLLVTFTDTSTVGSAPITSWDWDFGDGASSTSQNTSHIYAAPGTYTVTLMVTDSNGNTSSTSQDITI